MKFPRALLMVTPIIKLADGTEYKFSKLQEWEHEWDPEREKRKLVIPRGKRKDRFHGLRLLVDTKWSALPKAEKKVSGDSWADITGYQALVEIHQAGFVSYAPWGGTFYEMIVVSSFGWKKKRRYEREPGALSMESVDLYAEQFDISEGGA